MSSDIDFHIPTRKEFRRACELYKQNEPRGDIWLKTQLIVSENWGNAYEMARGIERLIRSWNRFFANFDIDALVKCLEANILTINKFKDRHINSLTDDDIESVNILFDHLLDPLKRMRDRVKSPVSVAKAFSLLAPSFLPLWDTAIAESYGCGFTGYGPENAARIYVRFMQKMKLLANIVKDFVNVPDDRSLLKRIDEYNYSKYTMSWLKE